MPKAPAPAKRRDLAHTLQKQNAAHERAARKYGLATGKEMLLRPRKYRWDIIDRDVQKLLTRNRDLPTGERGVIPEHVVNYMAGLYLSCAAVEGKPISEPLLHLVCQQLEVASFGLRDRTNDASEEALQIVRSHPTISDKELARRSEVSPKTIRDWRKAGRLPPRGGEPEN